MHSIADRIRERARQSYVIPAAAKGEHEVTIVAGDLVRLMGLQNRVPAVCSALASRAFLSENHLVLQSREGPPSGMGTRARFTYRLLDSGAKPVDRFSALRGILSELEGYSASIEKDRQEFGGV